MAPDENLDPRLRQLCLSLHGWTCLRVRGKLRWKEVEKLLVESYRQVALKRMITALPAGKRG